MHMEGKMVMEGMIDIHNHTLFGVDDGSKDIEQSKRMLEIAYKEGIRGIILTPHHNPYRWQNKVSDLLIRFNQLNTYCEDKYSDMKLYLGSELYYGGDTLDDITCGRALTMAEGRYVLVEFMPSVDFKVIKQTIMDLQQTGYYPIIAHIERYFCLTDELANVYKMKELGAFIQINKDSVMGEHGKHEKKFVKAALRDDRRMPLMRKCSEYVAKHYGMEYAHKIFIDNPIKIIKNEYIEE